MKSKLLLLALSFVSLQSFAGSYYAGADCGIARGWPTENVLWQSNTQCSLTLHLTPEFDDGFQLQGSVTFNVRENGAFDSTRFDGNYVQQGNTVFLYFQGKKYPAARGLSLGVDPRNGRRMLVGNLTTHSRTYFRELVAVPAH